MACKYPYFDNKANFKICQCLEIDENSCVMLSFVESYIPSTTEHQTLMPCGSETNILYRRVVIDKLLRGYKIGRH